MIPFDNSQVNLTFLEWAKNQPHLNKADAERFAEMLVAGLYKIKTEIANRQIEVCAEKAVVLQ